VDVDGIAAAAIRETFSAKKHREKWAHEEAGIGELSVRETPLFSSARVLEIERFQAGCGR